MANSQHGDFPQGLKPVVFRPLAARLKRLRKKADFQAKWPKSMPQGLSRLRKKSYVWPKRPKDIPQGLKPAFNLQHLRHD